MTLWRACEHLNAHVVDLTWGGAIYGFAWFLVGIWTGRRSTRPRL